MNQNMTAGFLMLLVTGAIIALVSIFFDVQERMKKARIDKEQKDEIRRLQIALINDQHRRDMQRLRSTTETLMEMQRQLNIQTINHYPHYIDTTYNLFGRRLKKKPALSAYDGNRAVYRHGL